MEESLRHRRLLLASVDVGRFGLLADMVADSPQGPFVAVSANAADFSDPGLRDLHLERTCQVMEAQGLVPCPFDLRDLTADGLSRTLSTVSAVWFCPGSAFWLAHLLRDDMGDALVDQVDRGMVFAAAGLPVAVAGMSLESVRPQDEPSRAPGVPRALQLVPFSLWPRYGTPGMAGLSGSQRAHLELTAPVRVVRDGEVVVVEGTVEGAVAGVVEGTLAATPEVVVEPPLEESLEAPSPEPLEAPADPAGTEQLGQLKVTTVWLDESYRTD